MKVAALSPRVAIPANRVRVAIPGVLATIGLVGVAVGFLLVRYGPVPAPFVSETQFDPVEWRASDPNYSGNVRLRMARNLERRGVLIGKTRPEVEALLGRPMTEDEPPGTPAVYYMVGTDWLDLMPEPVFLVLEFAGGKVAAIRYARS